MILYDIVSSRARHFFMQGAKPPREVRVRRLNNHIRVPGVKPANYTLIAEQRKLCIGMPVVLSKTNLTVTVIQCLSTSDWDRAAIRAIRVLDPPVFLGLPSM